MQTHLVLTISSQDRPGVIESLSSAIESCGASWQESKLAHLAGKFVGVIKVHADADKTESLKLALKQLESVGILISVDSHSDSSTSEVTAKFTAVGPDRTGIVKEISSAFVRKGINVEELETDLSSAPYSGDPIFEASGVISLPSEVDLRELHEKLDEIANDLGLDIRVDQNSSD